MKVKFIPQDVECEIKLGESVLHVAQDNGIYIKSVCKGVPSCAECRVRVVDGEHNVLPPGSEELSLIGTGYFIDRRRLSCQLKCFGDITVDMTEQIAKEKGFGGGQKKRKLAANDDRIEDATAIRAPVGDDEFEEDGGTSLVEEPEVDDDEDASQEQLETSAGSQPPSAQGDRPQGKRRRRRRGGRNKGPGGGGGSSGNQGGGRNNRR